MNLRQALARAVEAARANLLPGLLLQALMIVFLMAYVSHEGTRRFLAQIADLKDQAGYAFAFCSYVLSAALLPEILKIGFFQNGRATRENLRCFLTSFPAWGIFGMIVDLFYRLQAGWFGTGHDWHVVLSKMAVDQFIFSPFFSLPLMTGYFLWRDHHYRVSAFREIFSWSFVFDRVFPAQVAGWCIWIPAVSLVYFMPSALQIPVASLIQAFWVLVFLTIGQASNRRLQTVASR